jgi:outer membrane protein assembly factor BamB
MKHVGHRILLLPALLLVVAPAGGADWPQFLGPARNGLSSETGLARSWPKDGPTVTWTVQMGPGFGGAAIHSNEVLVLDRVEDERDDLRVFDLDSGKQLWNFTYDAPGHTSLHGSRSTPAVDEHHVYTIGLFGHIHCIDRTTHKPRWTLHLIEDFATPPPGYGFGQSPLLTPDAVILAPLSNSAGVVALEKKSGRVLWRSKPIGEGGNRQYASTLSTVIDGVEQIIVIAAPFVVGVDASNGEELWRYEGFACRLQIAGPTPVGDGRFFVTGGYGAGSAMIKVGRKGNQFAARQLMRLPKFGSIIPNALYVNGHLFANCNTKVDTHGLTCIDLDGNVLWNTADAPRLGWGSLIAADGLIYLTDSDTGMLHLIDADPEVYTPLASAKLLSGKDIWGPLALSDGRLIIRDQAQMRCVDVRAQSY